jgi:fido (protein-threonine AMPylation protein)
MMQEEANDSERTLSEYFIKTLHKTLIREDYTVRKEQKDGSIVSYTVHAGQYKTRPNSVRTVTGELFEYASPEETPALMNDLVEWYNETSSKGTLSAIELASLFHYRYIRIHPFEDGNGRIARLLVNYILLQKGYPMIIIRSDEKENYLSALNRCDTVVGLIPSDGAKAEIDQIQPFVECMEKCMERALIMRIKAAKGENIDEEDDWKKKLKILSKKVQSSPSKTNELVNKALKENLFVLNDKIIESLTPFKDMFFKIEVCGIKRVGAFDYGAILGGYDFTTEWFKEKLDDNFADDVDAEIIIQISENLREYDMRISVGYRFYERNYEISISLGVGNVKTESLKYNQTLSQNQIDSFVNFIGQNVLQFYERYLQDDKEIE